MEEALEEELRELGARDLKRSVGVVRWRGTLETAYRVCLWSRIANRVLWPIGGFSSPTPEALYGGIRGLKWSDHLDAKSGTLAVEFHSARSQITHTQFGAQKTKDAIVDQLRDVQGARPSVDLVAPKVRVHVHLLEDQATVSIDLSGTSLHLRGTRPEGARAPLKENLAATLLRWAGLRPIGSEQSDGSPYVPPPVILDPFCGSGTLLVEAAWILMDRAPGLSREYFGFLGWRGHDAAAWQKVRQEARERFAQGKKRLESSGVRFCGGDLYAMALSAARRNLERAEISGQVTLERRDFSEWDPAAEAWGGSAGLWLANPPYGERLEARGKDVGVPDESPSGEAVDRTEIRALYGRIGERLKHRFSGWRAGILTTHSELIGAIGLKPTRRYPVFNGPIECRWVLIDLYAGSKRAPAPPSA